MNKDAIIKSLQNSIIDTFVEFAIINNNDNRHLIIKQDNCIDVIATFNNAVDKMDHKFIKDFIDHHCDFETVFDHWQQIFDCDLDEDELSDLEFYNMEVNNKFEDLFNKALSNVYKMVG